MASVNDLRPCRVIPRDGSPWNGHFHGFFYSGQYHIAVGSLAKSEGRLVALVENWMGGIRKIDLESNEIRFRDRSTS